MNSTDKVTPYTKADPFIQRADLKQGDPYAANSLNTMTPNCMKLSSELLKIYCLEEHIPANVLYHVVVVQLIFMIN